MHAVPGQPLHLLWCETVGTILQQAREREAVRLDVEAWARESLDEPMVLGVEELALHQLIQDALPEERGHAIELAQFVVSRALLEVDNQRWDLPPKALREKAILFRGDDVAFQVECVEPRQVRLRLYSNLPT